MCVLCKTRKRAGKCRRGQISTRILRFLTRRTSVSPPFFKTSKVTSGILLPFRLNRLPFPSKRRVLFFLTHFRPLPAYNVVTGNAPPLQQHLPAGDGETTCRKRRRDPKPKPKPPPPRRQNREIEENDAPMSHQDYIDRRRQLLISNFNYHSNLFLIFINCDFLLLLLLNNLFVYFL